MNDGLPDVAGYSARKGNFYHGEKYCQPRLRPEMEKGRSVRLAEGGGQAVSPVSPLFEIDLRVVNQIEATQDGVLKR